MAFSHQLLKTLSEAIPLEEFTAGLNDIEPSFPVYLKDFTDLDNNIENLAKKPKYLKELLEQLKPSQHDFTKEDEGFTKCLNRAEDTFLKDNIHIYRFYSVIYVMAILVVLI